MADRENLNIALTPELAEFVERQVSSGQYASAAEVVQQGLRELQEREAWKAEVREKIEEGLKSLEQGQGVPAEQVWADLDEKLQQALADRDRARRSA